MKIYYAHPMSWYDTSAEKEDIVKLNRLGYEVLNPNQKKYSDMVNQMRRSNSDADIMSIFTKLVKSCDAIAYRPFKDDTIGAGVAREVLDALVMEKKIINLSTMKQELFHMNQILSIDDTRSKIKKGIM